MITTAVAGPSVMVNLLSFEATSVFTVVGDHAVECSLETRASRRSSCAIGVYED
jgi:hypothetical protein